MSTATLNVRLPQELKDRGMEVLDREEVSVSELIRDVFKYMEETQQLPELVDIAAQSQKKMNIEAKRKAMQSLIGVLPENVDLDAIRYEHLMHKTRPGVRD